MALLCSSALRHKVPVNYLLLFAFTYMEAMAVATTTAEFEPISVLTCIGATIVLFAALCLATLMTYDQEKLVVNLVIGIISAVFLQLIASLLFFVSTSFAFFYGQVCWIALGTFITGGYVVCDLLWIMQAGRVAQDEYILGAIDLYIDLVRLFLYILQLFGKNK